MKEKSSDGEKYSENLIEGHPRPKTPRTMPVLGTTELLVIEQVTVSHLETKVSHQTQGTSSISLFNPCFPETLGC